MKKIHISSQKRSSRDSLNFWRMMKRKHCTKGRSPKQFSPWEVLCSFLSFHGVVYNVFVPLENQTVSKQFSSEFEKVFYNSRHEYRLYVSVNSCNRRSNTNWRVNWIDWVICSPASRNQSRLFDEYQIWKLFPFLCSRKQVLNRGTKEFLWQSPLAIRRRRSDNAISIWRQKMITKPC